MKVNCLLWVINFLYFLYTFIRRHFSMIRFICQFTLIATLKTFRSLFYHILYHFFSPTSFSTFPSPPFIINFPPDTVLFVLACLSCNSWRDVGLFVFPLPFLVSCPVSARTPAGSTFSLQSGLSWSDWMSARFDCLLEALEVFLLLAIFGDEDFLELAEFVLGLSGRVEVEEREDEVLCFLG